MSPDPTPPAPELPREVLEAVDKIADKLAAVRNIARDNLTDGFAKKAIYRQVEICFETLEKIGLGDHVPEDPDWIP